MDTRQGVCRGDIVVSGRIVYQIVIGTDRYGLILSLYHDGRVERLPQFLAEKWCRLASHDGDNYANG